MWFSSVGLYRVDKCLLPAFKAAHTFIPAEGGIRYSDEWATGNSN